MNFLNQYCAFALDLESILLAPALKIFLPQICQEQICSFCQNTRGGGVMDACAAKGEPIYRRLNAND
jgi:hypothetical protein